jgi:cytochrome c oxidase subunit 3
MSEVTTSAAFRDSARERDADRLGMWVFVASEALLFGALILAYLMVRLHHAEAFAAGAKELSFWLGSINTAVLLTSSLTMALADSRTEERDWREGRLLLWATALFGILFITIKFVEYREELDKGLAPLFGLQFLYEGVDRGGAALFFALYFVMTGLHALHLLGGIALLAGIAFGWMSTPLPSRRRRVSVAALYWHFVDVVWVFLYPLLYLINR